MTKDNVKLLDMDEHQREMRIACLQKDIVEFCRKYDLIIDLATSDVVMWIKDHYGGEIAL